MQQIEIFTIAEPDRLLRTVDLDDALAAFIAKSEKGGDLGTAERVRARFAAGGSIRTARYRYQPISSAAPLTEHQMKNIGLGHKPDAPLE